MFHKPYRAHPDGVYHYENGGLRRIEEGSEPVLCQIESALALTRNMFMQLSRQGVRQSWDDVFECMGDYVPRHSGVAQTIVFC